MYQSIHFDKETKEITIFDDSSGYLNFKYKPYYWKKISNESSFHSIYGDPVQQVYRYSKEYFENDIHPILRTLVDKYYKTDDISVNNIGYFDIEVSSIGGFPIVEEGDKEILSITIGFNKKKYIFLKYDYVPDIDIDDVILYVFKTEEELFDAFCNFLNEKEITILTSWNGDRFDVPYLINRMDTIGFDYKKLSPIKIIEKKENGFYIIACRSHLDFMELYKKYCINDRVSYSLDAIGELELGIGKVKHEGLDKLYKEDILGFIHYAVRDVVIMEKLEDKLNYLSIAITLAHEAHIPYEWIYSQSKIIEGSIFTYLKRNNLVAINRPETKEQKPIRGAYVKEPISGLHKSIIDLDFTSLYPNIIRTLNISPEKKIGRVLDWEDDCLKDFYNYKQGNEYEDKEIVFVYDNLKEGRKKEFNVSLLEFIEKLRKRNWAISCTGIVFDKNELGFIPKIITEWFDNRIHFQKLKDKHKAEGKEELVEQYDIKQYVKKIEMNSFYGALAMPSFRFYDRENAESVTVTSQYFTKFTEKNINKHYDKKRAIYCDTDSVFVSLDGLVKNIDDIKKETNELQKHVNDKLEGACKNFLGIKENNYLELKQELIAKSGIFIAKKKYALLLVEIKGHKPTEDEELEIKGIDVIKSSFPIAMKFLLKDIIKDILDDKCKDDIDEKLFEFNKGKNEIDILDFGINTGVKNLGKYYDEKVKYKKGTPVHCKAALNYNLFLERNNLSKIYKPIKSGDKIKYFYLKNNDEEFKEFALSGEDYCEIAHDLVKEYIDRDKIMKSVLSNKVKRFYDALNWQFPDFTQNINQEYF